MIKWLLSLFGYGKIKSVESIMAPMVKTVQQLEKAETQNNEAIALNIVYMQQLEQANKAHAAQANLSNVAREGIQAQLKPFMDAKRALEAPNE
ncbi:hypothetical protein CHOED_038 [Vibrio phage CHOED]|uniref:hypothetical protein n=1 Tax=Vibrio phage CHOED TaxID=1458716 RepID=UPI00042F4EF0|nr:hypothetical protein CHOED_038 [Vibrio phage CHOED]AHK11898.1 hypothetical protein CHOED_038 [Vibrio phage CHOED]